MTGQREACLLGRDVCGLCFTRRTRDMLPLSRREWAGELADCLPPGYEHLRALAVPGRKRRVRVRGSAGPVDGSRS